MIKSKMKVLLADREMTIVDLQAAMQKRVGNEKTIHYTTLRRFVDNPESNGRISVEFLTMTCEILGVGVGDIFVYVPASDNS